MRLIDADEIKLPKGFFNKFDNVPKFYEWLGTLPTVDAVPVVRCKDCIHKPTGSGVNHDIEFPEQDYRCPCRCEDYWYSWMPDDDWFCANGERRKNETD